jgi:hypothetical protein
MTSRNAWLALLAAAVLAVGCGQGERPDVLSREDAASPPPTAADRDVAEPGADVITGELRDVDLDAETLVLVDDAGMEHRFAFSPETRIVGATSARGLAGQDGARVKVHYHEAPYAHLAVAIELIR